MLVNVTCMCTRVQGHARVHARLREEGKNNGKTKEGSKVAFHLPPIEFIPAIMH